MPTYEYACKDCGEHRDVFQSFHDDPLTVCPTCGGHLRKVFSAAGIIFKGSGWHVKDYASTGDSNGSNGASGTNGSSSSDGSDGDSSSSGDSSDSKASHSRSSSSEASTASSTT